MRSVILALALLGSSCRQGAGVSPNDGIHAAPVVSTVKYYGGFAGYSVPLELRTPLSQAAAEARGTYLAAEYDSAGRVAKIQLFRDGQPVGTHVYEYDASGKFSRAVITSAAGRVTEIGPGRSPKILDDAESPGAPH